MAYCVHTHSQTLVHSHIHTTCERIHGSYASVLVSVSINHGCERIVRRRCGVIVGELLTHSNIRATDTVYRCSRAYSRVRYERSLGGVRMRSCELTRSRAYAQILHNMRPTLGDRIKLKLILASLGVSVCTLRVNETQTDHKRGRAPHGRIYMFVWMSFGAPTYHRNDIAVVV